MLAAACFRLSPRQRWITRGRSVLVGVLTILAHRSIGAQSVSPPIVEYDSRKVAGEVVYSNPSLLPRVVTIDLRGFHVTPDGHLIDEPLDTAHIHVTLSATSLRIPPRSTATVSYEIVADAAPVWFQIMGTWSPMKSRGGLTIRLELPHVIYINQREGLRKDDVQIRSAVYDGTSKQVTVDIENTSARLGRLEQVTVEGPGTTVNGGAAPLFPLSHRVFVIAWSGARPPERVVVQHADFGLSELITDRPPAVRPTP
jgi:hypothetical protein